MRQQHLQIPDTDDTENGGSEMNTGRKKFATKIPDICNNLINKNLNW
jgi:hypothetical protein